MGIFSLLILCVGVITWTNATPPVEWPLKAVTWNVNGVSKIRCQFPELQYLKSFDVALLQETFSTDETTVLELDGFIAFHSLARVTGGRPQWGLTNLVKISSMVGGKLHPVPVPNEWILACRWVRPSGQGVLILNLYIPVHSKSSGIQAQEISQLSTFFRDLATSFPGDYVICGGDFNLDRWKTGRPLTPLTRYF
jgi:exonuclease III